MLERFYIDNTEVGADRAPYVIAEISGNHNHDIGRAKALIECAREAGAQAVKLQTYTAESLTLDSDDEAFTLQHGTWAGRRLFDLYRDSHTPWDWLPELFEHARSVGITLFSSPFDGQAVSLLETLDTPAYKIASNELTDWPLLESVARTGKPILLSTGTASRDELRDTIAFLESLGTERLVVLHCVSAYPAPAADSHLRTMLDIRRRFDVPIGLSDHTLGVATAVAAVALGACVIEKHITLDREDGGPDSSFSLEPAELRQLCRDAVLAWESLGTIRYGRDTDLKRKGIFTRQFWSVRDIAKGETLSVENIRSIRADSDAPGISPRHYAAVLGSVALTDIPRNSPIEATAIGMEI